MQISLQFDNYFLTKNFKILISVPTWKRRSTLLQTHCSSSIPRCSHLLRLRWILQPTNHPIRHPLNHKQWPPFSCQSHVIWGQPNPKSTQWQMEPNGLQLQCSSCLNFSWVYEFGLRCGPWKRSSPMFWPQNWSFPIHHSCH